MSYSSCTAVNHMVHMLYKAISIDLQYIWTVVTNWQFGLIYNSLEILGNFAFCDGSTIWKGVISEWKYVKFLGREQFHKSLTYDLGKIPDCPPTVPTYQSWSTVPGGKYTIHTSYTRTCMLHTEQ